MSESTPRRRRRPYGVACIPCRQKKRACDGLKPSCSNCQASQEACVVPSPARHLRRMTVTSPVESVSVSELEATVSRLSEQLKQLEDRVRVTEDVLRSSPSVNPMQEMDSLPENTDQGPDGMPGPQYRLTWDEAGNVTYHGVTGLQQEDTSPSTLTNMSTTPAYPIPSLADSVSQNEALAPIFQALATSKHISVAPELGDALLSAYHCYEIFEFTDRASFLRDMVLGGPCYSELLLMVLYASASRMIDGLTEEQKLAQGDLFVNLAKAYLHKELDGPSKITTIQALLLLSSRECALDHLSQGWNLAGLAFRMIQDLGMHQDPALVSGIANLSLEEQATRDRVFWAAFIWDKTLSLALGREPTLLPRPGTRRQTVSTIGSFGNDEEPWVPFFVHPMNRPASLEGYVYPRQDRGTCFRRMTWLCVIVHDIITNLYGNDSGGVSQLRRTFVASTRQRLDELWLDVPLEMRETSLPSPPPYVFMLLMFFHASYILLHRPIVGNEDVASVSGPAGICLEHSQAATDVATRFTGTFGDHIRYLPRYSWFVAASFDVQLLDSTVSSVQQDALKRLHIWLKTMERNLLRAPSMKRSVQHISSRIYDALSRDRALAESPIGRTIKAFTSGRRNDPGLPPPGLGSFDPFDFIQT